MTDRDVMQRIMQVLGPSAVCECAGCEWETNEALRLLREAGIEYQGRRGPRAVPHEPAKERLGNALVPLTEPERRALNVRPSITCPTCQRVSYHPQDIRERYCGHCHRWHTDMGPRP